MPFIRVLTYSVTRMRYRPAGEWLWNQIRIVPLPFTGSGNGVEFVELNYNSALTFAVDHRPPQSVAGPACLPRSRRDYAPTTRFPILGGCRTAAAVGVTRFERAIS
jgi:hypothetical protein